MEEILRDEDARAKFVRLTNIRVPKAIKAIELVGNLSVRSNYTFSEADAKAIIKALKTAVAECEDRFAGKVIKAGTFKLT
jgi:hypothetical protein